MLTRQAFVTGGLLAVGLAVAACSGVASSAGNAGGPVATHTVTAAQSPPGQAPSAPGATPPGNTAPGSAAPAPPEALPSMPSIHGGGVVEPDTFPLAEDGTVVLQGLTWSSWTAESASGAATLWAKNCTPNCANGQTVIDTTVSVALSDPVGGTFQTMVVADPAGNTDAYYGAQFFGLGSHGIPEQTADSYVTDIWNAGISAPAHWIDSAGRELCSLWGNGETTAQTDPMLLAGGIYPQHVAAFDSITANDLCPSTPGGPGA